MSIASEIARLQAAKVDIMAALVEKGVDVTGKNLADVPDLIDSIVVKKLDPGIEILFDGVNSIGTPKYKTIDGYVRDITCPLNYGTEGAPVILVDNDSSKYIQWEEKNYFDKNFTLDYWIKLISETSSSLPHFSMRFGYTTWQYAISTSNTSNSSYPTSFWLNDNRTASSNKYIDVNRWHHVAIVRNGVVCKYFIDGILVETKNGNLSDNYAYPYVGGYARGSFYITQMCVRNYCKWDENFVPSTIPYIMGE